MNGGDFVFQVQYHDGAGRLSHMGDCREYLLLSSGAAFTAGRPQADDLRPLRIHLERLISWTGFLSFVLNTACDQLKLNASSSL
jgi:hypothetical protein